MFLSTEKDKEIFKQPKRFLKRRSDGQYVVYLKEGEEEKEVDQFESCNCCPSAGGCDDGNI